MVVSNRKMLVKSLRNRGHPHPASTIIEYSIVSRPRSNSPTKAPVSRYLSMSDFLSISRRATEAMPNVFLPYTATGTIAAIIGVAHRPAIGRVGTS